MITITVQNVDSRLSDYSSELEEKLTVPYENYWFSPRYKAGLWDGRHHFLKVPSLKFSTGLLHIVVEFFNEKNVLYEVIDQRMLPKQFYSDDSLSALFDGSLLSDIVLRDYQIKSIESAIKKERGVLELPTGSGKTEIAAGLIKIMNQRTLFLVHTKDLLNQTVDRFKKRIGLSIGSIGEGRWDVENKNIIVATVQSLNSKLTRDEKNTKKFLNSFIILFMDEVHHASAKSWSQICSLCKNAYYRYGLSGTILRRDILSNMKMLAAFGEPIYRLPTMQLIDEGYLSPIRVEIIRNEEAFKYGTWQEIYEKGVANSEARNKMIVEKVAMHWNEKKKIMILVRYIRHGENLQMMLRRDEIPAIFLQGISDREERENVKKTFNDKGDFVLIASPIFDEGVDIPEINILINAAAGESEVKTIQKVGRGLRPKKDKSTLIVYDFLDSSKYLRKHSLHRIKVYKKEGFLS